MGKLIIKNIRKFKHKSIYVKFLIYFICFITLPTIFTSSFIYFRVSDTLQQKNNSSNLDALENIGNELDIVMSNISTIAIKLAMDHDVMFFLNGSSELDMYMQKNIYNKINSTILANSYIDSIYIYFNPIDMIATNHGIFSFSTFYDKEWYNIDNDRPVKSIVLPTRYISEKIGITVKEKNIISFVLRMPITSYNWSGAVAVNVSQKTVGNIIKKVGITEINPVFLIDKSGNIISSSMEEVTFHNLDDRINMNISGLTGSGFTTGKFTDEDVMISYTKPSGYGWRLVQFTPISVITRDIRFIKNLVFAVVIITTLMGLQVFYFVIKRLYKPITYISDIVSSSEYEILRIQDTETARDEVETLRYGFDHMTQGIIDEKKKNSLLLNQIGESRIILLKSLLRSLLTDTDIDGDITREKLAILGWPQGYCVVGVLSMDKYAEFQKSWMPSDQALLKFCLINVSEELMESRYEGIIIENLANEWVFVLRIPEEEVKEFEAGTAKFFSGIQDAIQRHMGVFTVSIGIGNICRDVTSISESYTTAKCALHQRWIKGRNTITCYSELKDCIYYYCIENETKILTAIKRNDFDSADEALSVFLDEIKDSNKESLPNIYNGIMQLTVSMIKVLQEMGYDIEDVFRLDGGKNDYNSAIAELNTLETLEEVHKWMQDRLRDICDYLNERRGSKIEPIIRNIVEYIHENYQEDIYLSMIATKFGISQYSLSRAFKKETGENFSKYVNMIRINKAKQILREKDKNISEVAKMVGYASPQTFIQTFKKYEGITPGNFRGNL